MNWSRIVLDGISTCLLFNAVVGMGFMLWPQAYSTMFPKLQRSFKPGDPKSRRAVCGQQSRDISPYACMVTRISSRSRADTLPRRRRTKVEPCFFASFCALMTSGGETVSIHTKI